jgi:RNA polymerase sigma factor (sigma-70 family)
MPEPTRTDPPGPPRAGLFPHTRFSVLEATRSGEPHIREEALETLTRAYWKPVYKYVRIHWNADPADAEDFTQAFFLRALDADFFQRFDPARARFRTWLRLCVNGFVSNERKAASRKKRGGETLTLSLDFRDAEGELRRTEIAAGVDPDEFFRQESFRHLFAISLAELRDRLGSSGRGHQFAVFEQYDLAPPDGPRPTYQEIADRCGAPVTQVTNWLHAVRRELRGIVLDSLRAISGTESEFRQEAIELLGVDPADVDS